MCWSGEASTLLASAGFAGSFYSAYKGDDKELYIPLFYFSLMEALQAFTYTVINQCALPSNQIATLLGYLHIAFQPFFINSVAMYFVPDVVRKRFSVPVYTICFISAIVMLVQLYPFDWAGHCDIGRPLCEEKLCSVSGNWHIAWDVPANGIGNYFYEHRQMFLPFRSGYITYTIAGFFLPFLYGSWRFNIYQFCMGPLLANLLTNNANERPAVWCLLSIGLLMIVVKTPIRKYLHVKHCWFQEKTQAPTSA